MVTSLAVTTALNVMRHPGHTFISIAGVVYGSDCSEPSKGKTVLLVRTELPVKDNFLDKCRC
jgi:hypothetical protein